MQLGLQHFYVHNYYSSHACTLIEHIKVYDNVIMIIILRLAVSSKEISG